MQPHISIIVPSYNKQTYIAETLNSVINQTYVNWELIIIDDVSSDDTVNRVNAFVQKDERIKLYINAENKGANYSRNFGLKQALGKYVIFLDADDLLSKDCLLNRLKHIENTKLDFCVFSMHIFQKSVGDLNAPWIPDSTNPLKDFLSHKLPWQTMQPIWKKDLLLTLGGFDEAFKRMQDVELHTRVLFHKNVQFKQVAGKPDCYYRIDEDRKNFGHFQFLERWVESALLYFDKFYDLAKINKQQKFLLGTLFKTYLQILYHYKINNITKTQFLSLKYKLLNPQIFKFINLKGRICFQFSGFYNQLPIKIPGLNFITNKILMV